ncbi:unnamed protein product [Closterium sp. NIES-64]|nr:unnamed protein product [Closterium sp. NIES-64]
MGGERRTTFGDPSGWAFEASRRRASRLDGWRSACHAWGRTAPGSESAEKRLLPSLPSSHCCRVPLFRCPFPPHLPFCSTKSSFGDASATPPVVCRSAIVLYPLFILPYRCFTAGQTTIYLSPNSHRSQLLLCASTAAHDYLHLPPPTTLTTHLLRPLPSPSSALSPSHSLTTLGLFLLAPPLQSTLSIAAFASSLAPM